MGRAFCKKSLWGVSRDLNLWIVTNNNNNNISGECFFYQILVQVGPNTVSLSTVY